MLLVLKYPKKFTEHHNYLLLYFQEETYLTAKQCQSVVGAPLHNDEPNNEPDVLSESVQSTDQLTDKTEEISYVYRQDSLSNKVI